jgi:hypothetical protein
MIKCVLGWTSFLLHGTVCFGWDFFLTVLLGKMCFRLDFFLIAWGTVFWVGLGMRAFSRWRDGIPQ